MASRGCVIFVGNLPGDVREREVEDLFIKVLRRNCDNFMSLAVIFGVISVDREPCALLQYGRVRHIDIKTPPRPPAFSFVEFEDPR